MSIYQKRWSSVGSGVTPTITRSTPTATNVLSSGVEPSTVGTSWNSVRWNKPSTSYRASVASRFENNSASNSTGYTPQRTSRFLTPAAKNAADVASIGPSVSARASRFDSLNMATKEKYRNEARELINKWSSRERNSNISNAYRSPTTPHRTTFRSSDSLATTPSSTAAAYSNTAYRTSTSLTPTRPIISSTASRYSAERKSVLSPSPTPMIHTTPKADRPWRQRMAESSRIRSTLGDDVSEAYTARRARNASSRRSSLSELSDGCEPPMAPSRVPSYSALASNPSYRSRQSSAESSVFSPSTRFTTSSTAYVPYSLRNQRTTSTAVSEPPVPPASGSALDRSTSRSKSPTRENLPHRTPSQAPKNPSIRESSKERDPEKQRKRSIKERTARRASRQNSQQDSSSDEEVGLLMRSRSGSQVRRRPRKKSQVEAEPVANKSMQSSLYETGKEDNMIQTLSSQITESLTALSVAAESEGFQSCAASPLAPSISRSSSKNGVVKNQIIKSPSLIEVLGLPRNDSKTSLKLKEFDEDGETDDDVHPELTLDDVETSSQVDDESQYSAIAHFKPNKIKRLAPVPGLWKSGAENEEFISRNNRFSKSVSPSVDLCMRFLEPSHAAAEYVVREPRTSNGISKKIKIAAKKAPALILKTVVEPKAAEKAETKPAAQKKTEVVTKKPATPPAVNKATSKPAEPVKQDLISKKVEVKPAAQPTTAAAPAKPAEPAKPDTVLKKAEAKPAAAAAANKVQIRPAAPPTTAAATVKPAESVKTDPGSKKVEVKPATPPITAAAPVKPAAAPPSSKTPSKPATPPTATTAPVKPAEPVKTETLPKKAEVKPAAAAAANKVQIKPAAPPVATTSPSKPATPPTSSTAPSKPAEPLKVDPLPKKAEIKPAAPPVVTTAPSKPAEPPAVNKAAIKPATPPAATTAPSKPAEPPAVNKAAIKPAAAPAATTAPSKPAEPLKADPLPKKSEVKPAAPVASKPAEEAPKPGVEKKKVLLKKKKIVPIEEEKVKNCEVSKVFSRKAWGAQKTEKSLKMRNELKMMLRCKSAANLNVDVTEIYRRRPQAERATVIVDTPVPDVNHSVVRIALREQRKKRIEPPKQEEEVVLPPEDAAMSRSVSVASDTRASLILDEMRGTGAAVEWTRDLDDEEFGDLDVDYNGILVLPDKSILEQYISKRRRLGKLDRYRGLRPSSICSVASSSCASPCPSTVSELCLPSSVLVHEPRRRAMNSAEPADLCSTPVPLNSTPRGFSTKTAAPPPVVKPVPFEAPKTLFEKMIQDQAKRNRTAPTVTETPDQTSSSRRGSEDAMSSISQQFAAAAAAEKHGAVRYAAHIPVRSGEATSGRMSSGSVDSQQSAGGNLDAAAKNIDHVIDQARHRHHQHRNKFKEAIDYLDQIFEDLKKESDPDDKNNNDENNKPVAQQPFVAVKKKPTSSSGAPSGRPSAATAVPSSSSATSDSAKKPAAVRRKSTETNGSSNSSSFVTVKPAGNGKSSVHQAPSPVEVVIPVRKLSQNNNNASAYEPTVAETIVLAKKTDKMDFTRRWLHDDLQSLAYLPPANIAPNASYYQDFDEHSLGSCSAEVAAFNTTKERKTSGKPSRKVSDTSDTMIRPRPFRPQPVYPLVDGHPSAFEPFSAHTLPRVTSQDHIPSEMRRSGSQDPYNTLRSMRSEGAAEIDSSRPSPSAFQQVSPFNRNGSMRSSLRSLPDHSPVRHRIMQPSQQKYDEVKDPVLSIDQLVAELELNTENTLSSADKRRSFPTSFGRPAQQHAAAQPLYVLNDYEKPNRYRAEMRHVPTRGRVQNFATQEPAPKVAVSKAPLYSQPIRNPQPPQAQRSLDEAQSMLNRAVSQFSEQRQPHQHPSVYKQLSQQSFGSVHSNNAFETINQEKINPSRVEAMHNMFERGTAPTSWKMHQKEQAEERNQKMSPLQEATYATLSRFSSPSATAPTTNTNTNTNTTTNNNGIHRNSSANHIAYHEYTPQLPTTQPPQRPPGSANSSQGGYYSSNSSGIGSNYPQQQQQQQQQHFNNARRSLILDQQSISSRMPSVENDDDDGFYDNIGIYNDDRRYSRGSELENSASFRQLPPASSSSQSGSKHTRIGSFLRKIGGGGGGGGSSNRPPGSAASLMSLNKIANETVIKPSGGLMKSNSLSTEPWKKHVLDASMPREANNNHKTGLGARLKNSLFGSRKRLD